MHGHGHSLRSHIHKRMEGMTFEQKREYIRKCMAGEEKDG
jgi:hypothetical protein